MLSFTGEGAASGWCQIGEHAATEYRRGGNRVVDGTSAPRLANAITR